MTYPTDPGYQAHSETSAAAARRLTTAESMESEIMDLLEGYETGFTGDQLAVLLDGRGYPGVQIGTVSARLRGLEHKGLAIRTALTRKTRTGREANVWMAPRHAKAQGLEPQSGPRRPSVAELQQKVLELQRQVTRLTLENEGLRKSWQACRDRRIG